jgi:membrane protein
MEYFELMYNRLRYIFLSIKLVIEDLWKSDIIILANAVAFSAIYSAFPLLLLFLSIVGNFLGHRDIPSIALNFSTNELIPGANDIIFSILSTLQNARTVLGTLGIVLLIWFGGNLFYTIEMSVNRVFGLQGTRGILRKTAVSFVDMIIAYILLMSSVLTSIAATIISTLNKYINAIYTIDESFFITLFISIGPLVIVILFFFVIYKLVPAKKINKRAGFYPALFSGTLLEIARLLFGWFISNFGSYNKLYGALGAIVALIIWIHYSSIILLLGAFLTKYLDLRFTNKKKFQKLFIFNKKIG